MSGMGCRPAQPWAGGHLRVGPVWDPRCQSGGLLYPHVRVVCLGLFPAPGRALPVPLLADLGAHPSLQGARLLVVVSLGLAFLGNVSLLIIRMLVGQNPECGHSLSLCCHLLAHM